jgi:hypothetical protein
MDRKSVHFWFVIFIASWAYLARASDCRGEIGLPSNVLVGDDSNGVGRVREYTQGGVLVRTLTYANTPGSGSRDIIADAFGNVHIFNGTFEPVLTSINRSSGAIVAQTGVSGWSTVGNVTFGGVATYGKFVYATDMNTTGGSDRGIIRFDTTNYSATRYRVGTEYNQITVGMDNLLYAMNGNTIDVLDPTTMAFQRSFTLSGNARSIAVAANGSVFAVNLNDDRFFNYSSSGALLATLTTNGDSLNDINIDVYGNLVASSIDRFVLSNVNLSSYTRVAVGATSNPSWVAFADPAAVPEPSSILFASVLAAAFGWRMRRAATDSRPIRE